MTGDIVRAITLTSYGNAFLKDGYDISTLTLDHPSFKFENKVRFFIPKKRLFSSPAWKQYADSPITWLENLKRDGCRELRMVYQQDNSIRLSGSIVPDHKLAGFVGGGGLRFIESIFDTYSDFWQAREEVTDKDAPDSRIWTISYGRVITKYQTQPPIKYDIGDIKNRLRNKLSEIREFAQMEDLSNWKERFDEAIVMLNSPDVSKQSSLILPPGKADDRVVQLLAGSAKAWCFGGMGSWNDIGFTDTDKEERYNRLTAELYELVNESYLAVANS